MTIGANSSAVVILVWIISQDWRPFWR